MRLVSAPRALAAIAGAVAALALVPDAALVPAARAGSPPPTMGGWALYDRLCLACHGASGDGAGPAAPWLWPPPRAFTREPMKWRSAIAGPLRADVRAAIEHGIPASGMPRFGEVLDGAQLEQLVDVVLGFGAGQASIATGAPLSLGAPPPPDAGRGEALWQQLGCATCHGAGGRGDGPAARSLRDAAGRPAAPADLARVGGKRPRDLRAPAFGPGERHALALGIATGLAGTPMSALARPPDELWALADFLLQLRQRVAAEDAARPLAPPRLGTLAPEAIVADRLARLPAGTWPGRGEAASILFGGVIALQGPPPPQLAPAQARLSARQCARCHASQYRQWSGSLHAAAASPGLLAQLLRTGKGELSARDVAGCQRCHAPLPEQTEALPRTADAAAPWLPNPAFDPELRHQGITCAACHVRGWRRFGPPHLAASLLPLPGYPRTELAVYQRGDFCLPCHQLPARQALEGRPLLNTYKEWLDGPYFRRGIQCQHCHMPNREHTFRGVHDPDTFRQGVAVTGTAIRSPRPPDGGVTVRVAVTNAGAGHYLPTTPTPAAWLTIELLDGAGAPIAGAVSRTRIGRHIAYVGGTWRELEDTRIAPGETLAVARAWRAGRVEHARTARLRLEVHPDEYYERFYRLRLAAERHPEARAGYASALARAEANRYVALTIDLPIEPTIEPPSEPPSEPMSR